MRWSVALRTYQLTLAITAIAPTFAAGADLNTGAGASAAVRDASGASADCPQYTLYGLPAVEQIKSTIPINALSENTGADSTDSHNSHHLEVVYFFNSAASFPGHGYGVRCQFPTRSQIQVFEGMSLCVFGKNRDWVSVEFNAETVALPTDMKLRFGVWAPKKRLRTSLTSGKPVVHISGVEYVQLATFTLPTIRFRPAQTAIDTGDPLLWSVRAEGRSPALAQLLQSERLSLRVMRTGTVEVGRRRLSGLR